MGDFTPVKTVDEAIDKTKETNKYIHSDNTNVNEGKPVKTLDETTKIIENNPIIKSTTTSVVPEEPESDKLTLVVPILIILVILIIIIISSQ